MILADQMPLDVRHLVSLERCAWEPKVKAGAALLLKSGPVHSSFIPTGRIGFGEGRWVGSSL